MTPKTFFKTLFIPCLLALASCAHDTAQTDLAPAPFRFLIKTLTRGTRQRPYALFIPASYTQNKSAPLPVLIYLHDTTSAGTNPLHQLLGGLTSHIDDPRNKFPFLVIFPQSDNGTWNPNSENATDILAELDAVSATYPVDPDCVILTGEGTGGAGTWDIGAQNAARFAALVPMASSRINPADAAQLVKMPIRAYHGLRDPLAPIANDETPINKIRTLGGTAQLVKTQTSHDCQDAAFSDSNLLAWCHDQRRSPAAR